ncbi:DUF1365 domain-containing protein [Rhodoblastus sp.]|uniref:DUF1365 domain-containing protein n=1 Tax=Rhodoblastus sp. TaxID=1962975 RepID=UPI003F9C8DBA
MTERPASALYAGHVTHLRLRPRRHRFRYRVHSLLLDLDELETLDRQLRLFSVDAFNLFSFHQRDRGDGGGAPLKSRIEAQLEAAGFSPDGGPVRLLTMPRILGWSFNPLSVFFCCRKSGDVFAILWEVDNTFGQRHAYLLPVEKTFGGEILQTCAKKFYVSPFMDLDLRYDFRVKPPKETLRIRIDASDCEGLVLRAAQFAERRELTDAALARAFLSLPLQTLSVVGGIVWEAVKLWLKGIGLRKRPPPPAESVSLAPPVSNREKVH